MLMLDSRAGGLAVGAHLQTMGVDYAIVGRDKHAGDSWSSVYHNAKLHTVKAYSGLPFEPISSSSPEYLSATELAAYHREYAEKYDLSVYGERVVEAAKWTQRTRCWHVVIAGPKGAERLRARNIVYAGGIYSGHPKLPSVPHRVRRRQSASTVLTDRRQDLFTGQVLHSSSFTSAKDLEWSGKRMIVVGSATTAFDVAHEASKAGCQVTMLQRSPVRLYTQAHIEAFQKVTHNEHLPTEVSDMLIQEDPTVLGAQITAAGLALHKEAHECANASRSDSTG